MRKPLKVISITAAIAVTFVLFQNCGSSNVEFAEVVIPAAGFAEAEGIDTGTAVCNPLTGQVVCDATGETGLTGKLYYMTPDQHASNFNGDLTTARIDDYKNYGIEVPNPIFMTEVNVPAQNWDAGFNTDEGEVVDDSGGQALNEWFHLDLTGHLSLPAGEYEFGIVSDDGMRITFDNEVHINHDGQHAPEWKCSDSSVYFSDLQSRYIRVQYFQGPRFQIAMQLYYRLKGDGNGCGENGNWKIVPKEFFVK